MDYEEIERSNTMNERKEENCMTEDQVLARIKELAFTRSHDLGPSLSMCNCVCCWTGTQKAILEIRRLLDTPLKPT